MTTTTGGVPDGILSDPPKICDNRKMAAPTADAQRTIACTRLLRSIGNREDRIAYGGGFEDFLVGSAICIVMRGQAFRHLEYRRQQTGMSGSLNVSRLEVSVEMAKPVRCPLSYFQPFNTPRCSLTQMTVEASVENSVFCGRCPYWRSSICCRPCADEEQLMVDNISLHCTGNEGSGARGGNQKCRVLTHAWPVWPIKGPAAMQ